MDILHMYLREVGRYPVLSREEEAHCAEKAKEGDGEALETLMLSNLRFVVTMAAKYRNLGLPLVDLINEGNTGLIKALKRFDPKRGLRFVSFARWWIRHYMLKALFEQTSAVRLPLRYASDLIGGGGAAGKKLEEMKNAYRPLSLDQFISENESSDTVVTLIGSDRYDTPEEAALKSDVSEQVGAAMERLKPMERQILRWRFGFDGSKPLTLSEIGLRCSLTKERIRQIMHAAMSKIRYPLEKRQIHEYVST